MGAAAAEILTSAGVLVAARRRFGGLGGREEAKALGIKSSLAELIASFRMSSSE